MSVSAARPVSAIVPSARVAAARVGVGGVPAAVGLRDHHRQRVGDDVVHLAGDARALRGGREPRLLVTLDLEPLRAVDERLERLAPGAAHEAERPHREREDRRRTHRSRPPWSMRVVGAASRAIRSSRRARAPADRHAVRPPRAVHRHRVEREQHDEVDGQGDGRDEQHLEQHERVDRCARRGRGHAAPRERRDERGPPSQRRAVRASRAERRSDRTRAVAGTTSEHQEQRAREVDDEPVALLPRQQPVPRVHPPRVGAARAPRRRTADGAACARRSPPTGGRAGLASGMHS